MGNPRLGKIRVVLWAEEKEFIELIKRLHKGTDLNEIIRAIWERGDIIR